MEHVKYYDQIQAIRENKGFADSLLELAHAIVLLLDDNGHILYYNPFMENLCGHALQDVQGENWFATFIPEHDHHEIKTVHQDTLNDEDTSGTINPIITKHGKKLNIQWFNRSLKDPEGNAIGVLVIGHDITERLNYEADLRYFSTHDNLTGLYNRHALEEALENEVQRAIRYERPLSVFMVDIDHFKSINDTYGHLIGDEILKKFSENLENSIRNLDFVARYGGEEFTVILPETTLAEAQELATRLLKNISEHNIILKDGRHIQLTASIGVATFPEHGKTEDALLNAADAAMYIAKKSGRDQVHTLEK